ncbi:MAG TPA: hypothetical protein VF778_10965, partial [Xanthobacteraceae bacterium]
DMRYFEFNASVAATIMAKPPQLRRKPRIHLEQQTGVHSGNEDDQQRKCSELNHSVPIHYELPWD